MNKTANLDASDETSFGNSLGTYFADNINNFADGLAWKTIGVLALLCCIIACCSSCSKFANNVANDPT